MTPLAIDFERANREQAPGFTPGEVDIQPSQDRQNARQAPGFIPGVIELGNLHLRLMVTIRRSKFGGFRTGRSTTRCVTTSPAHQSASVCIESRCQIAFNLRCGRFTACAGVITWLKNGF